MRHGTCVASVAFGHNGIMIEGTLVAVDGGDANGDAVISRIFSAFGWIILDIIDKRRQGRSVINLSFST
jgi:hypothetical protein